jgi:hypothetical protein
MPFKSSKQRKLMEGIAHGMKPYAKNAPSKGVAEEFIKADQMDPGESITSKRGPRKFRRNTLTRVPN